MLCAFSEERNTFWAFAELGKNVCGHPRTTHGGKIKVKNLFSFSLGDEKNLKQKLTSKLKILRDDRGAHRRHPRGPLVYAEAEPEQEEGKRRRRRHRGSGRARFYGAARDKVRRGAFYFFFFSFFLGEKHARPHRALSSLLVLLDALEDRSSASIAEGDVRSFSFSFLSFSWRKNRNKNTQLSTFLLETSFFLFLLLLLPPSPSYKKIVPAGSAVVVEATIESIDGRKMWLAARVLSGGVLGEEAAVEHARARALFVVPRDWKPPPTASEDGGGEAAVAADADKTTTATCPISPRGRTHSIEDDVLTEAGVERLALAAAAAAAKEKEQGRLES